MNLFTLFKLIFGGDYNLDPLQIKGVILRLFSLKLLKGKVLSNGDISFYKVIIFIYAFSFIKLLLLGVKNYYIHTFYALFWYD